MRTLAADLHVHTALSPCASDAMTPREIVLAAIVADLEMIAICDHNSADNAAAVQQAARDIADDLFCVVAGIEITSAEEAHLLGWFPTAEAAKAASAELADFLTPPLPGLDAYGRQLVMDADGNILRESDQMLSWPTQLSLAEAADLIRRHEGLVVAAHVDRPSFSVISQLGFFPDDVAFDAIEISAAGMRRGKAADFLDKHAPLVSSSDAHYPHNIGDSRTLLHVMAPSFDELAMAIAAAHERKCSLA